MSTYVIARLEERWVTCCMCGREDDQTDPADRRSVPIWNGEPTTSTNTQIDGHKFACARCYLRWDRWDDKQKEPRHDR